MAEKTVFSRLLQRQRCIVLLDGFYEWKKVYQHSTACSMNIDLPNRCAGFIIFVQPTPALVHACTMTCRPTSMPLDASLSPHMHCGLGSVNVHGYSKASHRGSLLAATHTSQVFYQLLSCRKTPVSSPSTSTLARAMCCAWLGCLMSGRLGKTLLRCTLTPF